MADDQTTSGDETQSPEGVETQDQETTDTTSSDKSERVSRQAYLKSVGAEKNARKRAQELEARLRQIEDERLEAGGQKDELIKSLRAKLDGETKRTKDLYGSFARKSLSAQIKSAALEAGCIDPDAVISLADLSAVEVSTETFEADEGEIKDVINSLRKSKPYLFQKQAPKINTRMPAGAAVAKGGEPDFNKMSDAEIQAWLRMNG